MTSPREIVVVGAGIIGASIAWHLTMVGARVTVVDAGDAGGVATPNSFAWINASWGNPEPYYRLRTHSMARWHRLAEEVPSLPLTWTGGLCWDLPPDELVTYASSHARLGYGTRQVDREEASRIEPNLIDPPALAVHVAEEGAVEPSVAAQVLLADAVRRGAVLITGRAVVGLVLKNGAVSGIETNDGSIHADDVVLAAGAATPSIAATVGVVVPIRTPPGLIAHSLPHPHLLNGLVISPSLHMRQTTEGRIVTGADFSGADPGADANATAQALFGRCKAMLRGADELSFGFHTVGYRPTPADGFPIVGRPAGQARLYVAVMHSGITLAPAIGQFVAEELVEGRRDGLLSPYGLDRFDEAEVAAKTHAA